MLDMPKADKPEGKVEAIASPAKAKFPDSEHNMKTVAAGPIGTPSQATEDTSRADTKSDDGFDALATLAYDGDPDEYSPPSLNANKEPTPSLASPAPPLTSPAPPFNSPAPPFNSPAPPFNSPAPPFNSPAPPITRTPPPTPSEPAMPLAVEQAAEAVGQSSPFDPSIDEDVFTKTIAEAAIDAASALAGAPGIAAAASVQAQHQPDVLTRTVADQEGMAVRTPTPGGGRPSDVLPRPPASSVVSPARLTPLPVPISQAEQQHQQHQQQQPVMMAPPGVPMPDPAMAMPAAYALPNMGPQPMATPYPPGPQTPGPGMQGPTGNPIPTPGPVPTPGPIGPPPDMTGQGADLGAALDSLQHDPSGGANANAVWREAHPSAQKWAAKRQGGVVRTPKPGIIAMGLMLMGLGAYLLAIFLPSKAPLTAEALAVLHQQAGVDENAWRFSAQLLDAANLNAGLFILLGLVIFVRGALFKQLPPGHARKGISKPAIMLLSCFALLAVSFTALLLSASL